MNLGRIYRRNSSRHRDKGLGAAKHKIERLVWVGGR